MREPRALKERECPRDTPRISRNRLFTANSWPAGCGVIFSICPVPVNIPTFLPPFKRTNLRARGGTNIFLVEYRADILSLIPGNATVYGTQMWSIDSIMFRKRDA